MSVVALNLGSVHLGRKDPTTVFDNPENVTCPKCETPNPLEIVYGFPSNEMQIAESEGTIALGGCVIQGDDPAYRCRECGEQFGTI